MRTAVLANLVSALMTIACGGSDTEDSVRKALEQANMRKVDVRVDESSRLVHLQGAVDSIADRSRAEEVANAVVGTSGRVLNELTIAGVDDDAVSELDREMTERLDAALDRDPVLKQRDVNVNVVGGVVTVTGEVRNADEKKRVDDLIRSLPGVRDVANVLAVVPVP